MDDKANNTKVISSSLGMQHTFYLYGPVKELSEYQELISILRKAGPNDVVTIILNTPGGYVETMVSLMHAMQSSKANIVTHADGEVASAGTFIFLSGDDMIIEPYSYFMFHDASGGVYGKFSENIKSIESSRERFNMIAHDTYEPFFTEKEVTDIMSGHDYYCTAEEMGKRLDGAKPKKKPSTKKEKD